MASLWIHNGTIVVDTFGNVVLCDHCPCVSIGTGTGTGTIIKSGCGFCTSGVAASQLSVDLSGLTNAACNCSTVISTVLNFSSQTIDCTWLGFATLTCSSGPQSLDIRLHVTGTTVQLTIAQGFPPTFGGAVYQNTTAWDCVTPITLTLLSTQSFPACGWPATITLTPV